MKKEEIKKEEIDKMTLLVADQDADIKAKQDGTLYTDHSWFNYNINLTPTQESISNSNDFLNRAYSWRGEKTIVRNLLILDKNETNEKGS